MPLDLDDLADAIRTGIYGDDRATGEEVHAALDALYALLTELDRLQSGGCARDQGLTQFCAEAVAKDAEIARLTSELAAAQAGPVEWHPDGHGWEVARVGSFVLKLQTGSKCAGWRLFFGDARVTDGPETGPLGKSAAEAAYRRACGFPGR